VESENNLPTELFVSDNKVIEKRGTLFDQGGSRRDFIRKPALILVVK
jgi:hypothetical protein